MASPDRSDCEPSPPLSPHVSSCPDSGPGSWHMDNKRTNAPPVITPHAAPSAGRPENRRQSDDEKAAKVVTGLRKLFREQRRLAAGGSRHSASGHPEPVKEKNRIQSGADQSKDGTAVVSRSSNSTPCREPAMLTGGKATSTPANNPIPSRCSLESLGAEEFPQQLPSSPLMSLLKLSTMQKEPRDISGGGRKQHPLDGKKSGHSGAVKEQSGGRKTEGKTDAEGGVTRDKERKRVNSQSGSKSREHSAKKMLDLRGSEQHARKKTGPSCPMNVEPGSPKAKRKIALTSEMGEGPFLNLERITAEEQQQKKHIRPALVASGLKKTITEPKKKLYMASVMSCGKKATIYFYASKAADSSRTLDTVLKKSSTTADGIKVTSGPVPTKSSTLSREIRASADRTGKGTEFSAAPVGKHHDRSVESGKKLMLDPRKTSKQVSSVCTERGSVWISSREESGKKLLVLEPTKTPSKGQHSSLSEEQEPVGSSSGRDSWGTFVLPDLLYPGLVRKPTEVSGSSNNVHGSSSSSVGLRAISSGRGSSGSKIQSALPVSKGSRQPRISSKVAAAHDEEHDSRSSTTGVTDISSGGGDSFGSKIKSSLSGPKGARPPKISTVVSAARDEEQDDFSSTIGVTDISFSGGDSFGSKIKSGLPGPKGARPPKISTVVSAARDEEQDDCSSAAGVTDISSGGGDSFGSKIKSGLPDPTGAKQPEISAKVSAASGEEQDGHSSTSCVPGFSSGGGNSFGSNIPSSLPGLEGTQQPHISTKAFAASSEQQDSHSSTADVTGVSSSGGDSSGSKVLSGLPGPKGARQPQICTKVSAASNEEQDSHSSSADVMDGGDSFGKTQSGPKDARQVKISTEVFAAFGEEQDSRSSASGVTVVVSSGGGDSSGSKNQSSLPGPKGTRQPQISTKVSAATREEQDSRSSAIGVASISSGSGDSFGLKMKSGLPDPKGTRQLQISTQVSVASSKEQDSRSSTSGVASVSSSSADSSSSKIKPGLPGPKEARQRQVSANIFAVCDEEHDSRSSAPGVTGVSSGGGDSSCLKILSLFPGPKGAGQPEISTMDFAASGEEQDSRSSATGVTVGGDSSSLRTQSGLPGSKGARQPQTSTKVSAALSEEQGGRSSGTDLTGASSGGGDSFGFMIKSGLPFHKAAKQPRTSRKVSVASGNVQDVHFSTTDLTGVSSRGGDSFRLKTQSGLPVPKGTRQPWPSTHVFTASGVVRHGHSSASGMATVPSGGGDSSGSRTQSGLPGPEVARQPWTSTHVFATSGVVRHGHSSASSMATVPSGGGDSSGSRTQSGLPGPEVARQLWTSTNVFATSGDVRDGHISASGMAIIPSGGGDSSGTKKTPSCKTPLDPRQSKRQAASGLAGELYGGCSSVVSAEGISCGGDSSGSKFQSSYKIPCVSGSERQEVTLGLEGKQSAISVKTTPTRDGHHAKRLHHRHRHRHPERVRMSPYGEFHRSHRHHHPASGAPQNSEVRHGQVVTHHVDEAAATVVTTDPGPPKPKTKVLSLSDYKERRKQIADDPEKSASETRLSDSSTKETDPEFFKSSLAEDLILYYNTRPHLEHRPEMLATGDASHDPGLGVKLPHQNIVQSATTDDDCGGDVLACLLDIFGADTMDTFDDVLQTTGEMSGEPSLESLIRYSSFLLFLSSLFAQTIVSCLVYCACGCSCLHLNSGVARVSGGWGQTSGEATLPSSSFSIPLPAPIGCYRPLVRFIKNRSIYGVMHHWACVKFCTQRQ